jgi:hypothetical protein
MKITRIDNEKNINREVTLIDIEIDGIKYELARCFKEMEIRAPGRLNIQPAYANIIRIKGEEK